MFVSFAIYMTVVIIAMRNWALAIGLTLSIRILIPSFVRTPVPPFSLNVSICITLLAIIIVKMLFLRKKQIIIPNPVYPCIKNYILFLSVILLIPRDLSLAIQMPGWLKIVFIDLMPGFLICFCIKDKNQIKNILYFIYGSILLAGVYGILSYVIKLNPYVLGMSILYNNPFGQIEMFEEVRGALQGRTQGTLSHPLVWGQIVNVLLLFLLMIRTHIKKVIFMILFVVLFLNVIFCGSRAILLSAIIGIVLVLLRNPPKKIFKYIFITFLSSILLLGFASQNAKYQIYVDTIEATLFFWDQEKSDDIDIKGSSVELRLRQLDGSLYLIRNDLFTGLGQGWIDDDYQRNGLHPVMLGFESIIYRKMVETGLIGLIVWLFFYISLYKKVSRYTKKNKIELHWEVIFLPYLISLFMTDSFESFYLFLSLVMLSYLYINVSVNSSK